MRIQRLPPLNLCLITAVSLCACAEDAVSPPHYGAYFAFVAVGEASGELAPGMPATVGLLRAFIAGPQLMPDFISSPSPPFCMGFRFGAQSPPNVVNADAGVITIHEVPDISYFDLTMGPPTGLDPPTAHQSAVGCQRTDFAGTVPYVCDVPSTILLVPPQGTFFGGNPLTISVSGGENVGSFEVSDLQAPEPAVATASFNLGMLDPGAGVAAAWEPTSAPFIVIEMIGQLADGSAGAQIFCIEPGQSGGKDIPSEALALLPEGSMDNPLLLQTHLLAFSPDVANRGWGTSMVGVGSGQVGISCVPLGPACAP